MNDIYSVEQLSASWLDTNPFSTTYYYIRFLSFLLLYILLLGREMCLSLANTRCHIKQMWAIVTHLKLWPANATHNFKCMKISKPFCWTGQLGYLKVIYHPLYVWIIMSLYGVIARVRGTHDSQSPHIWGRLAIIHDSQSPHIRKHLCPILWQLLFICHTFIRTI